MPRHDYLNFLNWTSFYDTEPLRRTLEDLVDLDALKNKEALPRLLVSATNLAKGQIDYFYSHSPDYNLTLDHIIASGSLPPAFPMTSIGTESYWDGGLFDNTPLGAVLDHLDDAPDVERTVYVVNFFPNVAKIPTNMSEIAARMKNLQFANKSLEDVKLLSRFNQVAALMQALGTFPGGNPLRTVTPTRPSSARVIFTFPASSRSRLRKSPRNSMMPISRRRRLRRERTRGKLKRRRR